MSTDSFDDLSWHDSKVYSFSFPDNKYSIKFDIDFIIEWVQLEEAKGYQFLVAPAILEFENVFNLSINVEFGDDAEMYINQITRKNRRLSSNGKVHLWDYVLLLDHGEIRFTSSGHNQEFTAPPVLSDSQTYDR